ncbi:MAG: hypothetical protein AAFZ15_01475 [Bacteroidota bacterium]
MLRVIRFGWVLFFCVIHQGGFAQYSLSGQVVDQANSEPIPSATVILKLWPEATIETFSLTDSVGRFEAQARQPDHEYQIEFAALGYETFVLKLAPATSLTQLDTIVKLKFNNILEEVEVKAYRTGVIVNGDTVVYEPDVFTDGSEQNLEDVLKKIPGINITKEGNIEVGQQEVGTVLFEGDEFMNTNRKGLLKGIRAADVASIELIRNYQLNENFPETSNKTGGGGLALNIVLDSTNHNQVKLSTNLGVGYQNARQGLLSGYYLTKKNKIFVDTRANNTGETLLSLSDYLRLKGDVFATSNGFKRNTKVPNIFLNEEEAREQDGIFCSLNYSGRLNSQWRLSGYLYYFGKQNSKRLQTTELLSLASITNQFLTEEDLSQQNLGGEIRTQYEFSDRLLLTYRLNVFSADQELENRNISNLNEVLFADQKNQTSTELSFNHELLLSHVINKHHRLSFQFFQSAQQENNDLALMADADLPFSLALFGRTAKQVEQANEQQQNHYGIGVRQISNGKKWGLETGLDLSINEESFLFGKIDPFEEVLSEPFDWEGMAFQITQQGSYNLKQSLIKAGYRIQRLSAPAIDNNREYWRIHPMASLTLNSKDQLLRLQLTFNSETEISDFLLADDNIVLQNLNRVNRYNIRQQTVFPSTSLSLIGSKFNPLAGSTFFVFSRFNRTQSPIDQPFFDPLFVVNEQTLTPPQNLWMNGVLYDKKIFDLNLGVRTNAMLAWQDRYSFIDQTAIQNQDLFFIGGLSTFTMRDSSLNFQFDGEYRLGRHRIGSNKLSGIELASTFSLNGRAFKKRVFWHLGLSHVHESQQNTTINYYNLHGKMGFQPKGKNWSTYIFFNDLLNLNAPSRLSFSRTPNALITNRYDLFPGFITGNVSFQL